MHEALRIRPPNVMSGRHCPPLLRPRRTDLARRPANYSIWCHQDSNWLLLLRSQKADLARRPIKRTQNPGESGQEDTVACKSHSGSMGIAPMDRMASVCAPALARACFGRRCCLPQEDSFVLTCACQDAPVRRENHRRYGAMVTFKHESLRT